MGNTITGGWSDEGFGLVWDVTRVGKFLTIKSGKKKYKLTYDKAFGMYYIVFGKKLYGLTLSEERDEYGTVYPVAIPTKINFPVFAGYDAAGYDMDGYNAKGVNRLMQNRAAPDESGSRSEQIVKEVLSEITGESFPTYNAKKAIIWLFNDESYIELDGYNYSLRIAVEYNGPQHYRHLAFLGRKTTYEEWRRQVENSRLKERLCGEYNVLLINIPYTVSRGEFRNYILSRLMDAGKTGYPAPSPYLPPREPPVDLRDNTRGRA